MAVNEKRLRVTEFDFDQVKQNLKRLFNEGRISSITFNYYINSYNWGD